MYIRCGACQKCTRVVLGSMHRGVTCVSCGRSYSLALASDLGSTPDERYRRASDYARAHDTDLASAYSILLGIMPLEGAPSTECDVPDPSDSIANEPSPAPASESPRQRTQDYDVGFRDAVAEGYLTIWQAVQRGDRVLYASKLAQRQGLPMSVAFQIADNRITLVEARKRMPPLQPEASAPEGGGSLLGAGGMAIAVILAGGFIFMVRGGIPTAESVGRNGAREMGRPPVQPPSVETSIEIRSDPAGRVTEVRGAVALTVLRAFCASAAGTHRREPVRVVASKEGCIGYFREGGSLWAILIRREPGTGEWVYGNGGAPLVATKASDLSAGGAEASLVPSADERAP